MKSLSQLIECVPGSPTTLMMQKGRELAAAGHAIVNLAGGEPDFNTPQHIQEAAFAAIRAGDTHYPPSFGTPDLLAAIVAKLKRENNVHHITPRTGRRDAWRQMGALYHAGGHAQPRRRSVGARPVVGQLCADGRRSTAACPYVCPCPAPKTSPSPRSCCNATSPRSSKLIMVNSPNNPTGRVITRAEIDALGQSRGRT